MPSNQDESVSRANERYFAKIIIAAISLVFLPLGAVHAAETQIDEELGTCRRPSQKAKNTFLNEFFSGGFDRVDVVAKPKAKWTASGVSKSLLKSRKSGDELLANFPKWLGDPAPLDSTSITISERNLVELERSTGELDQQIIRVERIDGCWSLTSITDASIAITGSEKSGFRVENLVVRNNPCTASRLLYDHDTKMVSINLPGALANNPAEVTPHFARLRASFSMFAIDIDEVIAPVWPRRSVPMLMLVFKGGASELAFNIKKHTGWKIPLTNLKSIKANQFGIVAFEGKTALVCVDAIGEQ